LLEKKPLVLAFAGPAEVSKDSVTDLLNDYIGIDHFTEEGFPAFGREVVVVIPVTDSHLTKGITTVIDWCFDVDLPYAAITASGRPKKAATRTVLEDAERSTVVPNVNQAVVDYLTLAREKGNDAVLVLLYGENGDENSEALLDLALRGGVPALDLSAGLDDISFSEDSDEAQPEPQPEPEPEPERPRRRRGKAAEEEPAQEASQAVIEDEQSADESVSPPARTSVDPGVQEALDIVAIAHRLLLLEDERSALSNLTEVGLRPLTEMLGAAYETLAAVLLSPAPAAVPEEPQQAVEEPLQAVPEPEEPEAQDEEETRPSRRSPGRPRRDGTPAQARKEEDFAVAYIRASDGTLRKAGRGRPRRGQERVLLTPSEIDKAREDGLLVEDDVA
jgi:hypothetical protein